MKIKRQEFLDLKQDSMTVNEYLTRFNQLSRYAPRDVADEDDKLDRFINGLNDGLAYALEGRSFVNFQEAVNTALILERRRGIMDRKRKDRQGTSGGGSSKQARFGSSSQGQNFRTGQQQPQQQQQRFQQPYQQQQRYQQQSQQRFQQQPQQQLSSAFSRGRRPMARTSTLLSAPTTTTTAAAVTTSFRVASSVYRFFRPPRGAD